jgi:hypothetical protein
MVKNAFTKLGFGLGPDLAITGSLNLNMMLKIELFENKNYLLTYEGHQQLSFSYLIDF